MQPALSWHFSPFRLDSTPACLWRGAQLIPLRPKPLAVLMHLVAHAGQIVSKEALLDAVWPQIAVGEDVLRACIRQIRQALEDDAAAPRFVTTVHRSGYRFTAPVSVVAPSPLVPTARPPSSASSVPSVDPMVGREAELTQLHRWFARACQGERHIVCLTGEAGIGKTTLVDAFVAQLPSTAPLWYGRGQCIEHYGPGEAYLPLLEAFGRMGRGQEQDRLTALLQHYAPSWLLQMPARVPADAVDALQRKVQGTTRERMLRELAEAVEALTCERPLLLILEDLHWSDVSTIEWLAYVARRRGMARLLVLATYRPAEAMMHGHPIHTVSRDLHQQGHGGEIALGPLSEADVTAYVARRFTTLALPQVLARVLSQCTNGNPLFLVTVANELVQRGVLQQGETGWRVAGQLEAIERGVPESLRHLIEQQFERLPPEEQSLLEVASVAGVEFAAAALAGGLNATDVDVEAQCAALARRGQFVQALGAVDWPDGTVTTRYVFHHALYQDIIYNRIPAGRQAHWHRQISLRLEMAYGARVRDIASELAAHCVRGRDIWRALPYLCDAGQQAFQRHAYQEALTHLRHGLALLSGLPETAERNRQELVLLLALGPVLMATEGYAIVETEQVYRRAQALARQAGETSQYYWASVGCWRIANTRAELGRARALAEHLLHLAMTDQEPLFRMGAHFALGNTLSCLGEFGPSLEHFAQAIALDNPQPHLPQHFVASVSDPMVVTRARALGAWVRWICGYPDQAFAWCREVLAMTAEGAPPFSRASALVFTAVVYQHRREPLATQQCTEEAMALADEYGFPFWVGWSTVLYCWSRIMLTKTRAQPGNDTMMQARQGMETFRATGVQLVQPYLLGTLAEAHVHLGQPEEGLNMLAEALSLAHQHSERLWEAELYRLQGELVLAVPKPLISEAERSFRRALFMARRQRAKSWELRAAVSLARLWQQQDKHQAAYNLLAPVYEWFTEGFDTADLQAARALLDDLEG